MDKIYQTVKEEIIPERLNDVRLCLKLSRISDISLKEGNIIERWSMHGPPVETTVIWSKRRKPLDQNMILWRDTLRAYFYGINSLISTSWKGFSQLKQSRKIMTYNGNFSPFLTTILIVM